MHPREALYIGGVDQESRLSFRVSPAVLSPVKTRTNPISSPDRVSSSSLEPIPVYQADRINPTLSHTDNSTIPVGTGEPKEVGQYRTIRGKDFNH